ncbi:MAG TPA: PAS domain S-box protein [Planctomycetes bacterium]|nr:PAS domain S-box protein [Planctomycetota bacterium]HIL38311.1 PAS domain S-box protein [Planctomycetota bacterium]
MPPTASAVLDFASPFHLRCDNNWKILGAGPSLTAHMSSDPTGKIFDDLLEIIRPEISDASGLNQLAGQLILIRVKATKLNLRGQWQQLPDLGRVLLCSPWITSEEQMRETGIKLNQLGPQDASGDYLMLLIAARQQALDLENLTEKAQAKEARLAAIVEHMAEGLLLVDPRGRIQSANPASCHLLGSTAKRIEGSQVNDHLIPLPAADETSGVTEWTVNREDKKTFKARGSQYEIDTSHGPREVVLFRDATEEERLLHMQRSFLSMVSHELRTPLSAIQASLALATAGSLGEIAPEAQEVLEIAVRNGKRLHHLIDDVIDLERLQSSALPMQYSTFQSSELVLKVQEGLTALAAEAEVELIFKDAAFEVRADPGRILQVLINLVNNAIRHSPRQGAVHVCLEKDEELARFRVTDEGPGISAELRSRIFDRFYQLDLGANQPPGGAGLGLAISKLIVTQHKGAIRAEQGPDGVGSTFVVEIPLGAE